MRYKRPSLSVTYKRPSLSVTAIFGAVRPLAEVPTQSSFVWVVGFEDGVVMRRGGEGGDRCCIDCVLKSPDKRDRDIGPDFYVLSCSDYCVRTNECTKEELRKNF